MLMLMLSSVLVRILPIYYRSRPNTACHQSLVVSWLFVREILDISHRAKSTRYKNRWFRFTSKTPRLYVYNDSFYIQLRAYQALPLLLPLINLIQKALKHLPPQLNLPLPTQPRTRNIPHLHTQQHSTLLQHLIQRHLTQPLFFLPYMFRKFLSYMLPKWNEISKPSLNILSKKKKLI